MAEAQAMTHEQLVALVMLQAAVAAWVYHRLEGDPIQDELMAMRAELVRELRAPVH